MEIFLFLYSSNAVIYFYVLSHTHIYSSVLEHTYSVLPV